MKINKIIILFLIITSYSIAQKDDKVLLMIDDEKITVKEFKKVYEKNLNLVEKQSEKEIDKNLDLFINYKLKVREAYQLKLDTSKTYKREIASYRNQLIAPYLKDQSVIDSLVKESYERTKLEIKASHILVRIPPSVKNVDTLVYFNKIMNARNRILKGESFEKVAKEVSQDRSVKNNGGNLGYFSGYKMLKRFEDAAFNTKKDSISMPFKTKYGYHIVKVFDIRPSKGERSVAHILITGDKKKGKKKIDSVYKALMAGEKFEKLAKKVSNDISSKKNGGVLPKFRSGRMLPIFEKVAFSLQEKNEISKPFQSRFGWHIIKLLNVYPVLSFEESKKDLLYKLKRSGRYSLSKKVMIEKLKKKYTLNENQEAKRIFSNKKIRTLPKDSLQEVLFSINDRKFKQETFVKYLLNRRHKPIKDLYQMFIDEKVMEYYKDDLVYNEPEFAETLQEYKEGILLFELIKKKVWDKSNDSILLAKFFKEKKSNYSKPLENIKGTVINDFQKELESKWIADLRKKSNIKIRKRILKKLKKSYAKKSS